MLLTLVGYCFPSSVRSTKQFPERMHRFEILRTACLQRFGIGMCDKRKQLSRSKYESLLMFGA